MPVPTNPINDEATSEGERLVRAFLDVFGDDNASRTPSQQIVWAWLEQAGYARRPSFVPDADGKLDTLRAAITDGRRGLYLEIASIVEGGFDRTKLEVSR